VLEFLASAGARGFEFFQPTQDVRELGRQPTADEIRGYLDAAGLKRGGNSSPAKVLLMWIGTTLLGAARRS
jgi:hypothetical protein